MPKIPGIFHTRAVRALEKAGFRVVREGNHIVMTDGKRILTIPRAHPVIAFTMGGIAHVTMTEVRNRVPNKGTLLECLSRLMGNYHVRF